MVVYGGVTLTQICHSTPLGVCDHNSHSEQSFTVGKILRMGHYAVILQPYFRLNLRVC